MEKRAKKYGMLRAERDQMRRKLKRVQRLQAEMQEIIGEARERLGLDELEGEFGYTPDEEFWAFVPAPPPQAPPEDAKKKPEPPKTGVERRRELEVEAASDEPAPVAPAAPELQVLAGAGANGGGQ